MMTFQKRFFFFYFLCLTMTLGITSCSDSTTEEEILDFLTLDSSSLALQKNGINLDAAGGNETISFEAGQDWKAVLSGSAAWCTLNPQSGKAGQGSLQVAATANESGNTRTATFKLTSGSQLATFTVTQKSKENPVVTIPEGLSWQPEAPDADKALTLYYKADKNSELYGYTGDVYAHIGLYDGSSWTNVQADWGKNIDKCKFAKLADNTWSIELKPSIREWFASGETPVTNVALVVRSSDGSKQTRPDFFVSVTDTKYKGFQPGEMKSATMPAGLKHGINVVDNSTVTLVLYDKDTQGNHKDFAHVMGDFNNWTLSNDEMSQMYRDDAAGCWWITLNGLDATKEYAFQYYVGTKAGEIIRLADAYAEKVLDPDNDQWISSSTYNESMTYPEKGRGMVSVFKIQKDDYTWKVNDFKIANPESLVIYELLVRDFTAAGDLNGVMEKLDYLKEMGVNAIELMPTQEFDGNDSWGYNPCFFFAMDKAYGTKKLYKQFIDACHEKGIAVILDVVYNHATGNHPFAKLYWDASKNCTSSNNPWFNVEAPHPFSVFHDFNHESELVRTFVKRNLQFLLDEYKFDGFRFDLTKGFTQKKSTDSTAGNYDASRVKILTDYYSAIVEKKADAFVILEHFCDSKEETELANAGLHMWRNMNYAYCESAMGWGENCDFSGLYAKTPAWVGYMESHDEERMGYKQTQWGNYDLKTNLTNRMKQLALNTAFFLTVPGPKMIWQFGEMGYETSIDENGRTGRKPIHWEYLDNADRKALQEVYSKLMALRNAHPELFDSNAVLDWKVTTSYWKSGRSIYLESTTKKLVVVGNFTNEAVDVAFPAATGTWKNYFTGKDETVGAKVNVPAHGYFLYTNF